MVCQSRVSFETEVSLSAKVGPVKSVRKCVFGKVYTVPCHDTILRTILFRHNTDQEAAMWPNTVEAHQSARAPRQHQDLATTMDAVSFSITAVSKLLLAPQVL